ncbi:hypothetical protein, partial [Parapedobacter defluvii]|uniref:hypothetical protein n=1 Tax=Parapedobacter defluvii TaxID=2045106 RepID=UPI00333EE59E
QRGQKRPEKVETSIGDFGIIIYPPQLIRMCKSNLVTRTVGSVTVALHILINHPPAFLQIFNLSLSGK